MRYFIKAVDFVPLFVDPDGRRGRSEDYKPFRFSENQREPIVALLNASLFYWYWRTHSDGFHCGYADVYRFPFQGIESSSQRNRFAQACTALMRRLRELSEERAIKTKAGRIRYQEFYPKLAKDLMDQVDALAARHYSLEERHLDFIVNYDIKYRMGQGAAEEE